MIKVRIFHTTRDRSADVKVNEFLEGTAKHHPRTVIMGITHQTVVDKMENRVIDSVLVVYNTREDEEEIPLPRPVRPCNFDSKPTPDVDIPDPKQF